MAFLVIQEVEDAPQGADDGLHFLSHHALPAASCACVSITCKVKERTVEDVPLVVYGPCGYSRAR